MGNLEEHLWVCFLMRWLLKKCVIQLIEENKEIEIYLIVVWS